MSLVVLIAGWFPDAPVRDSATLQYLQDVYLAKPDGYVDFAPLSNVLDAINLLSERQHIAVVLGLFAMWGLWRIAWPGGARQGWRANTRSFAILLMWIAGAYVAAGYLPRPMASLASTDPDVLRIDFHSHTQSSKDGRRSYSPEVSRAWHHAGGYDVAYITDHGTFAGAERGLATDPPTGRDDTMLLGGIEVHWKGEHVGLLGKERSSRRQLSPDLHDVNLQGGDLQKPATAGPRSTHAPIVVWNHPRDPDLKALPLARGSVQAIEIANGALHGMDLVRLKRDRIVALAKQENLALLSGTDSHGWGYTAPNWTLMRIKGWRQLDRDQLASRIERNIRVGGFGSTRVVERATADPGTSDAALALSVFIVPWRMLTELSVDERRMWFVWIWVIAGVELALRRRRALGREFAVSPAS